MISSAVAGGDNVRRLPDGSAAPGNLLFGALGKTTKLGCCVPFPAKNDAGSPVSTLQTETIMPDDQGNPTELDAESWTDPAKWDHATLLSEYRSEVAAHGAEMERASRRILDLEQALEELNRELSFLRGWRDGVETILSRQFQ